MISDKCISCLSERCIPFVRYLDKIYTFPNPGQGIALKECMCKNENILQNEKNQGREEK
jgi:hypothetical protein